MVIPPTAFHCHKNHELDDMKATNETIDLEKYVPVTLHGVEFQCEKGHIWEAAVGAVWLQMPTCPICLPAMSVPATAWKGKWTYMLKELKQDKLSNEELARAIEVAHCRGYSTRSGSETEKSWKEHLDSLLFIQRKRATGE